jgi:hypothetical protein
METIMNKSDSGKEIKLFKILEASRQFINSKSNDMVFHRICDYMLEVSEARYVGLNLFDQDGKTYTTAAFSGISDELDLVAGILGFNPKGKRWFTDDDKFRLISDKSLMEFENLHSLTGENLPEEPILQLEKQFSLGQVIVVKIESDEKLLGDFTLFMPTDRRFDSHQLVEIFASQVGLFIEKNWTELQYNTAEQRFREMVEGSLDIVYQVTKSGEIDYLSPAW